ncbi:MAG: mannose-1-phosphate guanyltransferase [Actinomycetota bacterium]|nr:mannose-1-phosphate guanyltransferase [Actinomycetota bacterium]
MKAVVMAGGEGTRLRPLTSNQPKPMVPFMNKPVMEHVIELLKKHKIMDIVVTLHFLPQLIKNYFGEGTDMGVNLSYSIEESPLGTAGSVKNAEEHLNETFIVVSGDVLTDFNLTEIIDFHCSRKAIATIALKSVENPLEFGVVITDEDGRIQRFLEKPTWGQVFSDTINTGIYVIEPKIFEYIPENTIFDFSQDLFPLLLKNGKPLYGCTVEGYWCDIGNTQQYLQAHRDILEGKANIKPPGIRMEGDIWVGEGAFIHPAVDIRGPVVIGQHAKIEAGAEIREYSVIGNNVLVRNNAHIHRSIIWENSYIGPQAHLHGCVLGKSCDIKKGARLDLGVIVGDECGIGEDAVINHDVKIYPFKTVDAGATINTSIIWETRGMRTLFGKHGVSGLINIDITPDLAMHLAMAFGTLLKKDTHVMVSRDANRASRMIKRAIVAALNATGIHCRDLRVAPTPINRFNVRTSRCVGGVHIRVSPFDPQSIEIKLFDAQGMDIDEIAQRGIEKYFYREDFRRAFYNEIGEIIFPARTSEYYIDGLLKVIDKKLIRDAKFKVVVDYAWGSSSLTMPALVGKLGCDIIALNAYTDESKTTISGEEFQQHLKNLCRTVRVFKADFGILIDSACEKVFVVDDRGRPISNDDLLHFFVSLICQFGRKRGKIAVPLTVSRVVEDIAAEYGRKVIRTKVSPRALMEAALRKDVVFAGAQGGGLIFPQFLPSYDAIMTFCKLLEFLAKADKPISELVADLPECHLAHQNTFCSWELKGLVMRRLMERAKDKQVQLLDGVKIFDTDRWALILPDPEEPVFRIYAEADSDKRAKAEVENYIKFISSIVSS